jgi:hypothetical protein
MTLLKTIKDILHLLVIDIDTAQDRDQIHGLLAIEIVVKGLLPQKIESIKKKTPKNILNTILIPIFHLIPIEK